MALFTIGDPHLALGCDKPMDIFRGWEGYLPKLEKAWRDAVSEEDTVVLAGDISWAMKLEHTEEDFAFLQALPGRKIMLKGNHDLWWGTLSKMQAFLDEKHFQSLYFLHNNYFLAEGMALCGSRGWMSENPQGHDAKMIEREALRLGASLEAARQQHPEAERLVFLHYPPFYSGQATLPLEDVMLKYNVKQCFYGHLHSAARRHAVQGERNGICYRLISADQLAFTPYRVEAAPSLTAIQPPKNDIKNCGKAQPVML